MKEYVLQVDCCKPILRLGAFDNALLHQYLEWKHVQGLPDSQIQDWMKVTTFIGHDEVKGCKAPIK